MVFAHLMSHSQTLLMTVLISTVSFTECLFTVAVAVGHVWNTSSNCLVCLSHPVLFCIRLHKVQYFHLHDKVYNSTSNPNQRSTCFVPATGKLRIIRIKAESEDVETANKTYFEFMQQLLKEIPEIMRVNNGLTLLEDEKEETCTENSN